MALGDDDIPDTGAVFTFGKSRFADNTPNKFWIRNDNVVLVSCGDDHSAFVTENGRLYTFGANEWGQLGLGSSKSTTKPSSVKTLKQEGVSGVACGRLHTIVLSKAGQLYTFGAGGEGQLGHGDMEGSELPKVVQSLSNHKIVQMSCGTDHSFILTDAGILFGWGGAAEGQLGMGDTTECTIPREVPVSGRVKQVSCGYYHTAFVTEGGKLYTFGENDLGKLGLGDQFTGSTNIPTQVTGIDDPVRCVACGNNHTAVIAGEMDVFTFGEGSQGQLGLGPSVLQSSTPRVVSKLKKHRCKYVSCGESHTAVVTENGCLYTFGNGRHGKLAQGEESFSNLFVPERVRRFKGFYVEQVSCGGCHTLVRARRRNQKGDPVSSNSETEMEETNLKNSGNAGQPPAEGQLGENLKKLAESIDLQGSLGGSLGGTARGRRRQRETSPLPPLARTLPPLSTSTPKTLPALGTRTTGDGGLEHSRIPNISADLRDSKFTPSSSSKKLDEETEDSEEESSGESGEDEVDAGTPVDEPFSQTYFSRSGNRSDMRPVASMKHKSKKKEGDGNGDENNNDGRLAVIDEKQPPQDSEDGEEEESDDDDEEDDDSDDDDDDDDPGALHRAAKQNLKTPLEALPEKEKDVPAKSSAPKPEKKAPPSNVQTKPTVSQPSTNEQGRKETSKIEQQPNNEEEEDDDSDDDDEDDSDDDDEDDDDEDEDEASEDEEKGKKSKDMATRDRGEKKPSEVDKKPVEGKGKADDKEVQGKGDSKTLEKKENESLKDGETEGQGDHDKQKEMEKKQPPQQPIEEERKPWQFWKKKSPPQPADEGSSTDPQSPSKPQSGNQARSKACIIL